MKQSFRVRLRGVTQTNEDGTNRQDVLRRCRRREPVLLVREPDNPYDGWAIAVHRISGEKLGYVPAGDRRLAQHLDQGGEVEAEILEIDGGPSLVNRVFGTKGKNFGCVVQIVKGDFDWRAVDPYLTLNRVADRLVKEAHAVEKDDPDKALSLYKQAVGKIRELDAKGKLAQAWRTTRHPINRISLILERKGDVAGAIQAIDEYLSSNDPVGISEADREAIAKRRQPLSRRP